MKKKYFNEISKSKLESTVDYYKANDCESCVI